MNKKIELLGKGNSSNKNSQISDLKLKGRTDDQDPISIGHNLESRDTWSTAAYDASKLLFEYAYKIIIILILIVMWFAPKPIVVEYSAPGSNVTRTNIYWPGFTEHHGRFLDSDYIAYLNEDRGSIYLCNPHEQTVEKHCQEYPIKATKGSFAALRILIKNKVNQNQLFL